jgi:hypothetical protein
VVNLILGQAIEKKASPIGLLSQEEFSPVRLVKGRDNGIGTSSRDQADRLADRYGGVVEEID